MSVQWHERLDELEDLVSQGLPMKTIGAKFGVSAQRVYQILTKFGISTTVRRQKNFLRDKGPEYYWLNRRLIDKGFPKEDRRELLQLITPPVKCPILGLELDYSGTYKEGWSNRDSTATMDRIDSRLGYTADNVQIISWRANRIKNDSTPEELFKIAQYMLKLKR